MVGLAGITFPAVPVIETLRDDALTAGVADEADRAVDVGAAGVDAGPCDADATLETVGVGHAEGRLGALTTDAPLRATAVGVVDTGGVGRDAPVQTAGLPAAAVGVLQAAVGAPPGHADARAGALFVVLADEGFATDAAAAAHARGTVGVAVAGVAFEAAVAVEAAPASGAAIRVVHARIVTKAVFADAVPEAVDVRTAKARLLTGPEEADLAASAIGVGDTGAGSGHAYPLHAAFVGRTLRVPVAPAIAAQAETTGSTRKAIAVGETRGGFAQAGDATIPDVALGIDAACVGYAIAVLALLADRAIESTETDRRPPRLANPRAADPARAAVGVGDAGRGDTTPTVAARPATTVGFDAADRLGAEAGLADARTETVRVALAEPGLDAAPSGAALIAFACGVGVALGGRAAASGRADFIGAARGVVPAGVRAGEVDAQAVAEAVVVVGADVGLAADRCLDVTDLAARTLVVLSAALGVDAESRDAQISAGTLGVRSARIDAQAAVAEALAETVLVDAADRRFATGGVAAAELRAFAVVVRGALAHRRDDGAVTADTLRPGNAAVLGAGRGAEVGLTDPAGEAGVVRLAEAALVAETVLAHEPARAVVVRGAVGHRRDAGAHLANLGRDALGIVLATRGVLGLTRAFDTGEPVAARAGTRIAADAASAKALAVTIDVGVADLRFETDALDPVARLCAGAVRVRRTCAGGVGYADGALARESLATVLGRHAGAGRATERLVTAQKALASVRRRVAPRLACAGLTDPPLIGVTRVVPGAGGRLFAEAVLTDLCPRARRIGAAAGAMEAGALGAVLAVATLVVRAAAALSTAAAGVAEAARPAIVVGRARIGATTVGTVAVADAVVVRVADGRLFATRGARGTDLRSRALVVASTAVLARRFADACAADLVGGAVRVAGAEVGPRVAGVAPRGGAAASGAAAGGPTRGAATSPVTAAAGDDQDESPQPSAHVPSSADSVSFGDVNPNPRVVARDLRGRGRFGPASIRGAGPWRGGGR